MKCHDIQLMISGFIEKRLTDQQLELFLDHILGCQDCYDELEVYYIITTGLMQLDEDHTGTLDLKKNLHLFIEEQHRDLMARQRSENRRRGFRTAAAFCTLIFLLFSGQIFMTAEEGIDSLDDFRIAAGSTIQSLFVRADDRTETVQETEDPLECRRRFEAQHPLIPSYFSDAVLPVPEYRSMLEKER